jgi:tetratricopeptide (TPR) repeat protein
MDFFRQLAPKLREVWETFPHFLREGPGFYLFLALLAALAWFGVFGLAPRKGGRLSSRLAKVDLKEMIRQGNYLEAGRHYEARGKTGKALDLYRKGKHRAEEAALLLELGKKDQAKKVAKEAGLHALYGELCQKSGELEAAAIAFERAGQVYPAAQCYEQAGQPLRAARCYLAAHLESRAVAILGKLESEEAAALLEDAVRSSLRRMPGSALSLELAGAVRRAAQLFLAAGKAERAYKLAVDAGDFEVAVPIARDHLPPSEEGATLAARAGAHLAAAEIWKKLGREREEAQQRAEHYLRQGQRLEAAKYLEAAEDYREAAELWASTGDLRRAADLYSRSGELDLAADLFGRVGDEASRRALLTRIQARSLATLDDNEPTSRFDQTDKSPLPAAAANTAPILAAGRYRMEQELGRGGMGVVFQAEDTVLHRAVAYKVLPPHLFGNQVHPEQLLVEARAAARLQHPNIVQVFDAGRDENGFFVVMELVRGKPLDRMLQERPLTLKGVTVIGQQICAALGHAHERRLVHRDLKPSNLLWSDADKRIKLTDFGLARVLEDSRNHVHTQAAGTPSYMSPEQIRGEPVDPRSDIYAFGCVLFELLCRRPLFGGGARSIHQHLNEKPQDPRDLRKDCPPQLAELILRCLEKDAAKRPQTTAEVGKALQEIAARL